MPLDPDARALVDQFEELAADAPPIHTMTPDQVRAANEDFVQLQGPPEDVADVEDTTFPGPAGPVPVRIYRPTDADTHPAVLFSHGGGGVIWGLDSHDPLCRALANAAAAAVVAVDYRRAPEDPYPAALHDVRAALEWLAAEGGALGVDPDRVAVAGDSYGATLATVVCILVRDQGGPEPAAQVLHCPATDFRRDRQTESERKYSDGYLLSTELLEWYLEQLLDDESWLADPLLSPLLTPDLSGLPPALVQVAEFDPGHDEGVAYAERLRDAGVDVTLETLDGTVHDPWVMMAALAKGRVALDSAAAFLRERLG